MIFDFRRTDKGKLEWRESAENRDMCVMGQYKRVSHGFPINIVALCDMGTSMTWFVLDSIAMQMLDQEYDSSEFGSSSGVSKLVYFPNPMLIAIPWGEDPHILDVQGRGLAGSNLHSTSGRMCIGGSAAPFSVTTIEAILSNKANSDLRWAHDTLKGTWIAASGDKPKHFLIQAWPHNQSSTWQVPATVSAAARLLSRS